MFTLRQILEKTHEFNIDTHRLFIYFKQANDSKRRDRLISAMYALGIPAKFVNMCRLTLTDTKSLVKVGEKLEPFITTKGFRQGDGLSCDLFNICLEMIIRAANIDATGTIYKKALGYADDLDIITRDIRSLDTAVDNIVGAADHMGLQINISKTKYMFSTKNKSQSINLWC